MTDAFTDENSRDLVTVNIDLGKSRLSSLES